MSLVLLSVCEDKHCFPCNSSALGVMLAQYFQFCYCSCFFCSAVCFFPNEVGMFSCVCCVFLIQSTRLDCLLVWFLLSGSFLFVGLFFLNIVFWGGFVLP